MRPNTVLMNFRLPIALKDDFDQICQENNISMTTQLNLLIKEFNKKHPNETLINNSHYKIRTSRGIADNWNHHK